MEQAYLPKDSFTFRGVNSVRAWGIKVISYDVFSAPKRDRRRIIPFRHGSFDFGEKYHDEKIVRLDCTTTDDKIPDKAAMREVIYQLSLKGTLRLWDEPDKYYIGELMESKDLHVTPKYAQQRFILPMLCEPFAYGRQVTEPIRTGANSIDYRGTAQAPTLLIIRNPNDFPVTNITISAVRQVTS